MPTSQYRLPAGTAKSADDALVTNVGRRSGIADDWLQRLWHNLKKFDLPRPESATRRALLKWAAANGFSASQHGLFDAPSEQTQELVSLDPMCEAWRKQWAWFDGVDKQDAYRFLFCVQTYVGQVIRCFVECHREASGKQYEPAHFPVAGAPTHCQPIPVDSTTSANLKEPDELKAGGRASVDAIGRLFDWSSAGESAVPDSVQVTLQEAVRRAHGALDRDEPQTGKDHFRGLIHNLIPRKVRHALGEFYTPRWLAEWVLDRVGYRGHREERLLDPACGSGTFVVAALSRWLRHNSVADLRPDQHDAWPVVGIDTNPLAVLAARANYLLTMSGSEAGAVALADLPIVWADSILGQLVSETDQMTPSSGEPSTVNRNGQSTSNDVIRPGASVDNLLADRLGSFTHIAGNPPWVAWETLSHEYRVATESLWHHYRLFSARGMDTILGKGKKDLSMLMSYVASDRYLKSDGQLGFVITNSVFLNHGAGRGFRRFALGSHQDEQLSMKSVDDFSAIQPFENATTNSCVFVWQKGEPTDYPVVYEWWKPKPGTRIGANALSASEVRQNLVRDARSAWPSVRDDPMSAWASASAEDWPRISSMLRASNYRAYEGVNSGGANGIYWLEPTGVTAQEAQELLKGEERISIRNRADLGKKATRVVEFEIETKHLYPLVRGVQMRKWNAVSDTYLLMVQDPAARRGISRERLESETPLTLAYLEQFEDALRARAAYRKYFLRTRKSDRVVRETGPFYSMFNVGEYTVAPFKVAWHRMKSPLQAAVIGSKQGKLLLPQETHAFIPCQEDVEAHFLAAMLNSRYFNSVAEATAQKGGKSFASPHILERVFLPSFRGDDETHRVISQRAKDIQAAVHQGEEPSEVQRLEEQLEPLVETAFQIALRSELS